MTMMKTYAKPTSAVVSEEVIKKSRFLTYLSPTEDIEQARAFIRHIKSQHPSAAHHCWAHVAGAPWDTQVLGFSDDGEPTGTAGKPMLAQLQGSGVGEVTAVVVRYFGGIELGTGGLVKAYGQGVQKALKLLSLQTKVQMQSFVIAVPYTMLADVIHLITHADGVVKQQIFNDAVAISFDLPVANIVAVNQLLADMSRGLLVLTENTN